MILIISQNQSLAGDVARELMRLRISCEVLRPDDPNCLPALYQATIKAAIVDHEIQHLPNGVSIDLLNGLGKRLPVLVLQNTDPDEEIEESSFRVELSDAVTIVRNPSLPHILSTLDVCGVLQTDRRKSWQRSVAYFNPHVPTKMLMTNGGLGVLTIDASNFRKIEVEYGTQVYREVKDVFQKLLNEMWGKPGCFRASDVLCRRSDHGNVYYVFLNRSRTTGSLPLPGVLENIADRLNRIIQNALWEELTTPAKDRRLPACIREMPRVVVGFASAVHNPCLEPLEILGSAIDASYSNAKIQTIRLKDRYREMMTTLIQADHLIYPNYQAVFLLPKITKAQIDKSKKEKSIKPLEEHIFGFESLVRVRGDEIRALMGSARTILDPKFLRPDVLFQIAKSVKVALELDQACLNHALEHSAGLPGALMVNILPRNLYFLEYLTELFRQRDGDVIIEVSESESINNLELVNEIRKRSDRNQVKIAADDFGKAFAGLDRIIQMRPHLIKFDRSLVQDIHKDPVKHAYLDGLVKAARLLNTSVLAEGVELWEELQTLQKMGIDYVQGFLLHRPQPVQNILDDLEIDAEAENDEKISA